MKKICFILMLLISFSVSAQEYLTGISVNPVIKEKAAALSAKKYFTQDTDTIPVTLPFHDDFSQMTVFPSPDRWIDRDAYVNDDFPIYPINYGAVTLDAINDSGNLHSNAVPGPASFIADHLTSRFIRLDSVFTPVPRALTPADSVYLSFYYQPQGRGLALAEQDSLALEFYLREAFDSITPEQDTIHYPDQYQHIWATEGMKIDTFYINGQNQWFRRVMIPITDPKFFKKDFRFRFYNQVSLSGTSLPSWQSNADPWSIDEVYLNLGRSMADTIFPEIRFVDRPDKFLKNYSTMPYKQYSDDPGGEMNDTIFVRVTNRDIVSHQIVYKYTVVQPSGTFFAFYQSPVTPLPPYTQTASVNKLRAPVNFVFPISQADSNLFVITHTVNEPGSAFGDTIVTNQPFYNYFAYDDGTPEQGYGLKGANGRFAYRFRLNVSPDTLRAIRIYFNKTLSNVSDQYFYLTVWNDNNNKPGDTLYSRWTKVNYSDSLNDFYTYNLENPVPITGTFYVGTIQTTDDNLNIGFDSYNNAEQNMLYNVTGSWQNSVLGGSVMIRPVIGKPLPVGIDEKPVAEKSSFRIYPNPASGNYVNISSAIRGGNWNTTISTITGMQVRKEPFSERIDISGLSSGVFIVTLINEDNGERVSSKLIITR